MKPAPGETPKPARKVPLLKALLFIVAWTVPAAFVAFSPPFTEPYKPTAQSKTRIQSVNKVVHAFIAAYGKPPADLNMLRAYALAERRTFDAYDAHGQRFDYLRLDGRHYLLRSFGADGEQNARETQPDTGIVRWGRRAKKDLVYAYPTAAPTGFYPAPLAAVSESPGGEWLARIYGDPDTGRRALLVRSKTKPGLFMAARHDRVEEVLWLPNGQGLVFSATGSSRHRDGLFLWDLRDDSLTNLFDAASHSMPISPASRGNRLWVTLSGVLPGNPPHSASPRGDPGTSPTVFAYAAPRHDGPLDPAQFFTREQLFAIAIETKGKAAVPRFLDPSEVDLGEYQSPIARPYKPNAHLGPYASAGLPTQAKWLSLQTTGDMEQVLLKWHEYSEKEASSPLFPYCLWILSALYGESYAQLAVAGSNDADVLRTFGTEIARALIENELAPTYLKSLALFTYEALMEGERLPYKVAQIAVPAPPPKDDGNDG